MFSLKLIPIRFKIKFISLLILCIKLSRYILNHKDNFIFETKNTKSKATNSVLGSLVVALDIVFFVFYLGNLFVGPEAGTGCPGNLTICIVRVVSHF